MTSLVRDLLGKLSVVFNRRSKIKLMASVAGSALVALLDTAAIALVLPLVELATGEGAPSGATATVSRLFGDPDRETLVVILTIAVVGLFVLKDVGALLFNWWTMGFIAHERVVVSSKLLRHFLTAPYTEVSRRGSADLLRAMNDSVFNLFNFTVSALMNSVTGVLSIVAIVVALMAVAPLPTLALLAYFGLAGWLYLRIVKPRGTAVGQAMADASMRAWRTAFAALGAMKEVRIRGTQEHFVDNYRNASGAAAMSTRTANFLGGLPRYILEILFIAAVGLVLLLSALTSQGGGAGFVGLIALFVAAGFRVLPAITGLLGSISSIKIGGASLDIVLAELRAIANDSVRRPVTGPPLRFHDAIELTDVSFRYPQADSDVLHAINMRIRHGSSVALVGGSGAGKSTLVDIIVGLHAPRTGKVCIDGVDARTHLPQWQRNVGYVPQDVYLLDGTLAENIAFDVTRSAIDEQGLAAALAQAQLADLVAELPLGVDTPLGEKATRLSGGQRQRVGIARALYHQPQLLVLDEATSALDNLTEHRISETIASLRGDVTVLIVAHRLSTVQHCDQIAFMDSGRIETIGTFEDVQRDNATFAELVRLGSLDKLSRGEHT